MKVYRGVLQVVAYIIFIGLCYEAGVFICNAIMQLFYDDADQSKFYIVTDLSALRSFNESHFITLSIVITIVAILKAILFYIIICIFSNKNLKFSEPFNEAIKAFILKIAYLSLVIGLFSSCGQEFSQNLRNLGVFVPSTDALKLGGGDVWIFMGIILLIIANVFKRGIEIQEENELTV